MRIPASPATARLRRLGTGDFRHDGDSFIADYEIKGTQGSQGHPEVNEAASSISTV